MRRVRQGSVRHPPGERAPARGTRGRRHEQVGGGARARVEAPEDRVRGHRRQSGRQSGRRQGTDPANRPFRRVPRRVRRGRDRGRLLLHRASTQGCRGEAVQTEDHAARTRGASSQVLRRRGLDPAEARRLSAHAGDRRRRIRTPRDRDRGRGGNLNARGGRRIGTHDRRRRTGAARDRARRRHRRAARVHGL